MKKNLQKKDSQLQSKFQIGEKVLCLVETAFINKNRIYTIRSIKLQENKPVYGLFELISRLDDYPEHFFIKATKLSEALL